MFVEENFSATLASELRRVARELKLSINVIPKFRSQNKLHFIAQTLEPVIKIGRLYVHERVKNETPFLDGPLEAFCKRKVRGSTQGKTHLKECGVDLY